MDAALTTSVIGHSGSRALEYSYIHGLKTYTEEDLKDTSIGCASMVSVMCHFPYFCFTYGFILVLFST